MLHKRGRVGYAGFFAATSRNIESWASQADMVARSFMAMPGLRRDVLLACRGVYYVVEPVYWTVPHRDAQEIERER